MDLVSDPEKQAQVAAAISERPELLFKAAEHAIGKPRQTIDVGSAFPYAWTPPARVDEPVLVPSGTVVLPQGAHIHEGGEEEHHCHLCHENWAAKVDGRNECPRCVLHRSPTL